MLTEDSLSINGRDDKPTSAFANECNALFKTIGCQFSGDSPGRILEAWAAAISDRQGPAPHLAVLVDLVILSDNQFYCSADAERAFESLWRLLMAKPDAAAATRNAIGAIRVFVELDKLSSRAPALEVFDRLAADWGRADLGVPTRHDEP